MADAPLKRFKVVNGDELVVKLRVTDARDLGNIVCQLGPEWVRPSLADLEAVVIKGGRHVLIDPETGAIVMDPFGALGPGPTSDQGRAAIEAYDAAWERTPPEPA